MMNRDPVHRPHQVERLVRPRLVRDLPGHDELVRQVPLFEFWSEPVGGAEGGEADALDVLLVDPWRNTSTVPRASICFATRFASLAPAEAP
jgi:hypothetical protein